ncbi:Leucine-rich repeat-containing protein egg-6 [Chionoecetes opilio]|uniref:Leucine-rich repeat-containing protein egg-6 n=1 Tax=Chionoecetes opilio TaxID=41210 RepID=A0A8J5D2U6_CHIOP|nr:Leucine-rich repeat-containing protein egg-6 [Chionoecetes opilio]
MTHPYLPLRGRWTWSPIGPVARGRGCPKARLGNMEALEKLQVSGSSLTSLPALPRAPRLIELFLDNNLILSVPPKTFTQLSSLMQLMAGARHHTPRAESPFHTCTSNDGSYAFQYLDLAFNSLHSLRQDSLHLSHDVMVFLDHNVIAYIDERAFSGHLPTLLDVSSNALTGLDQRVFQPILDNIISHQYDSYVDATYNPLQCSSIHWLLGDNMYLYFIALPDLQCRRAH